MLLQNKALNKQECLLCTSKFPTEVTDGNGETGAIGLSEEIVFENDDG